MANTYAGFQRYEVPDIGGNVAKIMLAQQDAEQKRMTAEQLAQYRQSKLDADKAKEASKLGKEVEKEIEVNTRRTNDVTNSIPLTGFTTFDAALQGSVIPQIIQEIKIINKEYRTDPLSSEKYKTSKQSLDNTAAKLKNTATSLTAAHTKINEAKNASPYAKWYVNQTVQEVFPSTESPNTYPMRRQPNGEYKFFSQSFRTNENGQQELASETPFETIDAVAALPNVERIDVEALATTRANGVGKKAIEIKNGGGTQTDIDARIQQNFKDSKDIFVNTVTASPITAADAYIDYVNDRAIFIKGDITDNEKRKIADQNGYKDKPLTEVPFVVAEKDKTGMYIPKLNEVQSNELKEALGKTFDNKADKIVSINTPSVTKITANIINNDGKTDPTIVEDSMPLNTKEGKQAATILLSNASNRGDIHSQWKFLSDYPGVSEETLNLVNNPDMTPQTWNYLVKNKFVPVSNENMSDAILVYPKTGSGDNDYDPNKPIVISASKNERLYRQYMGYTGDASGFRNQTESTYPKEKKRK